MGVAALRAVRAGCGSAQDWRKPRPAPILSKPAGSARGRIGFGGGISGREEVPVVITRMSELFVRTLRDDPVDAEVPSHRWLIRAGYIRRAAPGIYSWLPLGYRVLRNVERIVREEMDAIGPPEVHFPALLPREPSETTGRW